jgi:hypothetical protein
MNRRFGAFLAVAVIVSGLITWTLGSASGAGPNRVTTTCAGAGFDARYFRKQVDPIASFGQAVSAHMHDFSGSLPISSTMAATPHSRPGFESDPGDIPPGFTNCPTYGDWPRGWVPSPLFNGVLITPGIVRNTWQSPAGSTVVAPPFGETFIAGDSHATSEATMSEHVRFTCGGLDGPTYTKPTDCTGVGVVTAQVTFPDCWDGTHAWNSPEGFDTPAGISPTHFSYSVNGACPPGTVPCVPGLAMAQLVMQTTFIDPRTNALMVNPNNADGTLGLSFSSGPYYTYHADYLNTWNHVLDTIVSACLNKTGSPPSNCPTSVNNVPIR